MEKFEKVTLLSSVVLVGFVFAVAYHYLMCNYLGLSSFYETFLWADIPPFGDFVQAMPFVKTLHPFKFVNVWINYFPMAYIFLYPFSLIKNVYIAYIIYVLPFLTIFWGVNIKAFYDNSLNCLQNFQNIFILSTITYPFLMLLDRGNIDIYLFIMFCGYIYFLKKEKYIQAALLIGIINAFKPFLWIFLCLFLFKKKFKELSFSIIISAILVVGGFLLLHGGFFEQICVLIKNLANFKFSYVFMNNNNYGMYGASSLFMLLKWLFTRLSTHSAITTTSLVKYYNIFSALVTFVIIFFAAKEKIFWKQITILTLYTLSIPYLIMDYKLIFLMIPIWLFINSKKTKNDIIYTVLFGLLLIPKAFIIPQNFFFNGAIISLSVILNPILMMIFLVILFADKIIEENNGKTY